MLLSFLCYTTGYIKICQWPKIAENQIQTDNIKQHIMIKIKMKKVKK